jgi:hypothetical protein
MLRFPAFLRRQVAYEGLNDVSPRDELPLERGDNILSIHLFVGRDSLVVIATRFGLDGPRIEARCGGGGDFSHPFRPALGPFQPPVQ